MTTEQPTPPPHAQLIGMMMGMWHAQIVGAAARFGLADRIAGGMTNSDALAQAVGADRDALYRLLRACAAVGVVVESEGRNFALTPAGECLRTDHPTSLKDLIIAEVAPGHWLPWGRLYDAVKSGGQAVTKTLGVPIWDYYKANPEEAICFARGMGNLSAIAVQDIASMFDPSPYHTIVDVGGSQGVLLRGLLQRAPKARGILFDLPEIIASAGPVIEGSGMNDRIQLVSGDFFKEVPAGGDLYLLKQILHDWDDAHAKAIVTNIHRAARPDARLLIIEMLLPDHPQPSPVALMDMNMLVMLGGRERTSSDFAALLKAGGFGLERVTQTRGMLSVIEAVRS